MKAILPGFILVMLYIVLAPAPWFRDSLLPSALMSWGQQHQEGAEYASYAIEVLLILLFGGIIFTEEWSDQIKSQVADLEIQNNVKVAAATGELENQMTRLLTLSAKPAKSRKEWRELFECSMKVRKMSNNIFYQIRLAIWVIGKLIPGGWYIFIAALLFIAKAGVDAALLSHAT
jgi:hypothetical protein